MSIAGRAAGLATVTALFAATGCSTPEEQGLDAPAATARSYVDEAASGFADAFRGAPGRRGVEEFADRLATEDSGSLQVVVLSRDATPTSGEIGMAVYSEAGGSRDGDPFGHWTIRMCVTLVAEGAADPEVTVERRACPDIPDPSGMDVDATVDY
ncbi:hypothetical protein [Nocardioides sp.]|uniref:hypothetical protein n=1 Tax=Nocardioides sp. TaxID=35761 RepID=UPI003529A073